MSREPRGAGLREERWKRGSSSLFSVLFVPFLSFLDCRWEEGPDMPGRGRREPEDRSSGTEGPLLPPGREDRSDVTRMGWSWFCFGLFLLPFGLPGFRFTGTG